MVTVTFELGNVRVQAEETQARENIALLERYWKRETGKEGELKEIKVVLPAWVAPKTLHAYLLYINTRKTHQQDVNSTLNLLDLAVLLEDSRLEATLLQSDCFVSLARNHSLAVLTTSARFKHRAEPWKALYKRAFQLVSEHLPYLLEKYKPKFAELSAKVAKRLYRKALIVLFKQGSGYDEGVFKALREVLECKSGVEMMILEEQMCIKRPIDPILLRNMDLTGENKEAIAIVLIEDWQVEAKILSDKSELIYSFKLLNSAFTIRLTLYMHISTPNCTSPTVITRIIDLFQGISPVYSLPFPFLSVCSIRLGLRAEFVLSALTRHLASSLDEPKASERLVNLSEEQLTAVLRSNGVKVATEDSVLYVVGKWAEGRREGPGKALNWVIWQEISLNCLIDCSRRFSKLRKSHHFREIFTSELLRRSGVTATSSPQPSLERVYRVTAVNRSTSLQTFLSEVASVVPELDYTPEHLPEHDPAKNLKIRQLHEKKIQLERLKAHFRILQGFNPPSNSNSAISIVPISSSPKA